MNTNQIIDSVLVREGGFVNRAADRGGATNFGITQSTLSAWRGRPATIEDVRNLSETEAREIYREEYITRPGFLSIENENVRALAVDCAVNHGPRNAVIFLQRAAHVFTDGVLGPKTKEAVNRMDPQALYRRLCAARVRFFGQIISKDPELKRAVEGGYEKLQALNAGGWLERAAEFIEIKP